MAVASPLALGSLLDLLEAEYGPLAPPHPTDPIALLLWENVAYLVDDDRRTAALEALALSTGLDPVAILAAPEATLLAAVAGMRPTERVARLRHVASLALQLLLPDPDAVLTQPLEKARRLLRRLPGVGDPSAERVLLFSGHHPVLALDSNALRVLLRLGLGDEDRAGHYQRSYRSAQAAAQAHLPSEVPALIRANLLLRRHGQSLCRRTDPACLRCPLQPHCRFAVAFAKAPGHGDIAGNPATKEHHGN